MLRLHGTTFFRDVVFCAFFISIPADPQHFNKIYNGTVSPKSFNVENWHFINNDSDITIGMINKTVDITAIE